jgi:hypothetical protein
VSESEPRPVMEAAHRGHRMQAATRHIDRWLTTYPELSEIERRYLAERLLAGPRS